MWAIEFGAILREYMAARGIFKPHVLSNLLVEAGYFWPDAEIVTRYLNGDPRHADTDFVHAVAEVLNLTDAQSFRLTEALHIGPPPARQVSPEANLHVLFS